MRRLAPITVASIVLIAGGCGSASIRHGVQSDWHAAANAMANGDGPAACRDFTAAVADTLSSSSGLSCAEAVRALAKPLTAADRAGVKAAKVKSVTATGAHATIDYELTPGLRKLQFTGRSRLVEVGGRWLIAPRGG